jgi:hypothetical protein
VADEQHIKGNHQNLWAGVGKIAAPFIGGVVAAAFWFGVRSQKLASNQNEIMLWKAEVAPQIQRMDSKGTAAGERFSLDQGKELGRMEKDIEELKKEARSIEAMKLKIEGLERAQLDRMGRLPQRP